MYTQIAQHCQVWPQMFAGSWCPKLLRIEKSMAFSPAQLGIIRFLPKEQTKGGILSKEIAEILPKKKRKSSISHHAVPQDDKISNSWNRNKAYSNRIFFDFLQILNWSSMDDPKKVGPPSRHHHPGHPLRAIMQRHRGYLQGHGFRQLATPQCLLFFSSKSVRFLCIYVDSLPDGCPDCSYFVMKLAMKICGPTAPVRRTSRHNRQALQLYLRKSSEFSTLKDGFKMSKATHTIFCQDVSPT